MDKSPCTSAQVVGYITNDPSDLRPMTLDEKAIVIMDTLKKVHGIIRYLGIHKLSGEGYENIPELRRVRVLKFQEGHYDHGYDLCGFIFTEGGDLWFYRWRRDGLSPSCDKLDTKRLVKVFHRYKDVYPNLSTELLVSIRTRVHNAAEGMKRRFEETKEVKDELTHRLSKWVDLEELSINDPPNT